MATNAQLLSRRTDAIPRGLVTSLPIFAERAQNAELWDVEGRRFVDFAAGIATLNTGHRHPRVVAAVSAQLERFSHTAFQVVGYRGYVDLCERLNALAPFSGPAKSVLFASGAEAVENAVKIARYATGRSAIITFAGSFHGRTTLAMAMTGKTVPYKAGFGSMVPDVFHAVFPTQHRGVSVDDSIRSIELLFQSSVDPARVAAVVIEPVQGEGGFNPTPPELLQRLRALCDEHGILLIADEVQTGFGRTGRMFGIEHSGVEPDLVPVAKALGGGFPISGVIGRAEIMDQLNGGGLGSTYGGSPIACAASIAVLDVIADEGLVDRAVMIGERLKARIATFSQRNDLVPTANLRGLGAMVAFDILSGQGKPDGATARAIVEKAMDLGLILLTCGPYGESIRILAPLTIPEEQIDEGLDILEQAMMAVAGAA